MTKSHIKKPAITVDTVMERIAEWIEAQRQCGKHAVLTFDVTINERKEIERVDVHPPTTRIA